MSKESRLHGLHRVFFSYADDREQSKRDDAPVRGTFRPEGVDVDRLLPRYADAPRRFA